MCFFFKNSIFKLNSLLDLFAVDKIVNIELNYVILSIKYNLRVFIKLRSFFFVPVFTISGFYISADWLEREVYDFFGVSFFLHKNLRRILTDYGFFGYPMRKSFPLVGFLDIDLVIYLNL